MRNRKAIIFGLIMILLSGSVGVCLGQDTQTKTLNVTRKKDEPIAITSLSFKDGEEWLGSIAIEVENISDKPIYFLEIALVIDNLLGAEKPIGISLTYGKPLSNRNELLANTSKINPIPPKGKTKLVVDEDIYASFKTTVKRYGSLSNVNDARLIILHANYGDGSGWYSGITYNLQGRQKADGHKYVPLSKEQEQKSKVDEVNPIFEPTLLRKLESMKSVLFVAKFNTSGTVEYVRTAKLMSAGQICYELDFGFASYDCCGTEFCCVPIILGCGTQRAEFVELVCHGGAICNRLEIFSPPGCNPC
ncbi:MAG: hypothetical protein AB1489_25275 [Acidobacteriota bacterium]